MLCVGSRGRLIRQPGSDHPSEGFDLGQVVTGLQVVRGEQVWAKSTSSGIGTPTGTLMSTLIRETLLPRPSKKRWADLLLPQPSKGAAVGCVLPAKGRVTDGARTRDLRSHNPNSQVRSRSPTFRNPLIQAVFSNLPLAGVRRRSPGLSSRPSSTAFAIGPTRTRSNADPNNP